MNTLVRHREMFFSFSSKSLRGWKDAIQFPVGSWRGYWKEEKIRLRRKDVSARSEWRPLDPSHSFSISICSPLDWCGLGKGLSLFPGLIGTAAILPTPTLASVLALCICIRIKKKTWREENRWWIDFFPLFLAFLSPFLCGKQTSAGPTRWNSLTLGSRIELCWDEGTPHVHSAPLRGKTVLRPFQNSRR